MGNIFWKVKDSDFLAFDISTTFKNLDRPPKFPQFWEAQDSCCVAKCPDAGLHQYLLLWQALLELCCQLESEMPC